MKMPKADSLDDSLNNTPETYKDDVRTPDHDIHPKLVEALRLLDEEKMAKMDEGIEHVPIHEFSDGFERKMDDLIKAHKKAGNKEKSLKNRHRWFDQTWKKVCAAGCLLFLVCCAIGTSVDAVRLPVINVLTEIYDDHMGIRIEPDDGPTADIGDIDVILYEPGWLPKGYKIVSREVGSLFYNVSYEKKNGDALNFQQTYHVDSFNLNNEGTTFTKAIVEGKNYYYQTLNDITYLYWLDESNRYGLIGRESVKTMIKISKRLNKI